MLLIKIRNYVRGPMFIIAKELRTVGGRQRINVAIMSSVSRWDGLLAPALWVANIGVADQAPADVRRVRTINLIAAGALFFNATYTIVYAVLDLRELAPVIFPNLLWIVLYLGAIYANSRGKTDLAMWMILVTPWANLIIAGAVLGVGTGVYLFLLLVPMLGVLVSKPGDRLIPLLTLGLGTMIFVAVGMIFTEGPQFLEGSTVQKVFFAGSAAGVAIMGGAIGLYYRRLVDRTEQALISANQRSERLLHAILPVSVADRLKSDEDHDIADAHAAVTVLFADIVGFTPRSAAMDAATVVSNLNEIFTVFDRIAALRGLEKIKTIGDAYMAAAGLPDSQPDHALRAATMALDLIGAARSLAETVWPELQLRIGVHTGPAVAGVIGESKFAYDVWGDTVNTASRLQHQAQPGEILVSSVTAAELPDSCQMTGPYEKDIPGKGPIAVYRLESVGELRRAPSVT